MFPLLGCGLGSLDYAPMRSSRYSAHVHRCEVEAFRIPAVSFDACVAHDRTIGRAFLDHQVDELARIPMDVRVDNSGIALLHSVLPFVQQWDVDAERLQLCMRNDRRFSRTVA
ncbi:MAG TPA: hypothetical protein VFB75_06640 [Burkholderiales bacterium]|nr:hypothetical protein [Burkholderiales bacterium]